ncbi:MAG: hypothetical protein AAF802_08460 [Planctomycetota bacterium]
MPTIRDSGVGFLKCEIGGVGSQSGELLGPHLNRDAPEIPYVRMHIDVDANETSTATHKLKIGLSPSKFYEISANPDHFGPEVRTILKNLADHLDPYSLQVGAKTKRAVTQLSFLRNESAILKLLHSAIRSLMQNAQQKGVRMRSIQPLIFTSTGGGCGSAGSLLFARLLTDPTHRASLELGYQSGMIQPPIIVTAYPIHYIKIAPTHTQSKNIAANIYATSIETDRLISEGRIQYVISTGYSNSAGVVLDSGDAMASVLASSGFYLLKNYAYLMSRWTDGVRSPRGTQYTGSDAIRPAANDRITGE